MLWFETCLFNQKIDIANVKHKNKNVGLFKNVWLLLSMLNTSFWSKLVFTVTMGVT
ncbi:hypothetical protein AB205_0049580, partial [Aquarana catesbeiana]